MWRRLAVGLLLPLTFLGGCSSDDDEEAEEHDWVCFEGSTQCWCADLAGGGEAGSSDPEVDACSYTNCFVYNDEQDCWCEPAPFTPGPPEMPDPRPVASCPPS